MAKKQQFAAQLTTTEAVFVLTSNDHFVKPKHISDHILKRIAQVVKGRHMHVDAEWSKLFNAGESILYDTKIEDREFLGIERCEKRVCSYSGDGNIVVSPNIFNWMIDSLRIPAQFTIIYDNTLTHDEKTRVGKGKFNLPMSVYELYKRTNRHMSADGTIKRETWSIR